VVFASKRLASISKSWGESEKRERSRYPENGTEGVGTGLRRGGRPKRGGGRGRRRQDRPAFSRSAVGKNQQKIVKGRTAISLSLSKKNEEGGGGKKK